jgi:glutathione S-transferase
MNTLTHFSFCPLSRSIRLLLGELGVGFETATELPWAWRPQFLALNPAGDLPVLELPDRTILYGAYATSEYLAEQMPTHPRLDGPSPIFPGTAEDRAEARRLVDWFHRKMLREVSSPLLEDKVWPLFKDGDRGVPDADMLRAVRRNLQYHMQYVSWLIDHRNWLAGDELSFADFAGAAHFSCLDYVSEVPWDSYPAVKSWYVRMKSRPGFQPLLADRVPGAPPPAHYTDLDF